MNVKLIKDEMVENLKAEGRESEIQDALKQIKKPVVRKELAYLEGQGFKDYMNDMKIAQKYAEFLRSDIPYIPHVTVGRKENEEHAIEVAKRIPKLSTRLRCIIEKVSVERIGESGESIIEFEVELSK